jgi:putative endonuclease
MIKSLIRILFPKTNQVSTNNPNVNVQRGCWGENVAASYLIRIGWRVIERNVRPCRKDRRCEIDIIAYVPEEKRVVFVEVKTHYRHSSYAGRLWAINRRKKSNLLRACACWLIERKWHGNFRFDVIEVYGKNEKGVNPEIDRITNVKLFPPNWRFW